MKVQNHHRRSITNLECIFLSNSLNRIEHFNETENRTVRNHTICGHENCFPGRKDSVARDFISAQGKNLEDYRGEGID
jgi:hypothetical protein